MDAVSTLGYGWGRYIAIGLTHAAAKLFIGGYDPVPPAVEARVLATLHKPNPVGEPQFWMGQRERYWEDLMDCATDSAGNRWVSTEYYNVIRKNRQVCRSFGF